MTFDPSSGGALPPTDHVARVLLKRGAREQALSLLRAAIARDPGEKACAALLRAVEARPDASVYGPDLLLDLGMVEAYTRSGWLLEGLAVLEGSGLVETPEGADRAAKLRELLAYVPEGADPHLREVDRQLRTGGASVALSMLDQRRGLLPPWAVRRHAILQELLLERASPAPVTPSLAPSTEFGRALEVALASRDLKLAFQTANAYVHRNPGDADAHAATVALERLVNAMAEASREMSSAVLRTQPMTGHHVALFQLRMANFDIAERMFRKLVVDDPLDQLARSRLDDIQVIRAALEGTRMSGVRASNEAISRPPIDPLMDTMSVPDTTLKAAREQAKADVMRARAQEDAIADFARSLPEPEGLKPPIAPIAPEELEGPTTRLTSEAAHAIVRQTSELTKEVHLASMRDGPRRPPSSPELLNKRSRPAWAERDYLPPTETSEWEEDQSTEIGRPDEHAELLVKQGLLPQALHIYEALANRHPNEPRYRTRITELQRLMTVLSGRGSLPSPESRVSFGKAPTEPREAWQNQLVQAPTAPAAVIAPTVPGSGADSAKPSDGEWSPSESHSMERGGAAPSGTPVQTRPSSVRPASEVLPPIQPMRSYDEGREPGRKAPWDDESTVSRDIVWPERRTGTEAASPVQRWDDDTTRSGFSEDRASSVKVRRIIRVI